jgi:pimeloyl-ACP methyl ester carboxylesterase
MSLDSHRATAYAGVTVTDYVRAGDGPVVLFLARQQAQHPIFAVLATAFRVIAPELPRYTSDDGRSRHPPPFASWLRDFLDGLGVPRVILVADDTFAHDAQAFSLTDPTRVDRVALLCPSDHRDESRPPAR